MQKDNPFFQDLSRLASSATGAMMETRREFEQMIKAHLQQRLDQLNLVTREEFEVVKAMAEKAREENDALRLEIESLKTAKKSGATKSASKKKSDAS